jgi:hypothetical protein
VVLLARLLRKGLIIPCLHTTLSEQQSSNVRSRSKTQPAGCRPFDGQGALKLHILTMCTHVLTPPKQLQSLAKPTIGLPKAALLGDCVAATAKYPLRQTLKNQFW